MYASIFQWVVNEMFITTFLIITILNFFFILCLPFIESVIALLLSFTNSKLKKPLRLLEVGFIGWCVGWAVTYSVLTETLQTSLNQSFDLLKCGGKSVLNCVLQPRVTSQKRKRCTTIVVQWPAKEKLRNGTLADQQCCVHNVGPRYYDVHSVGFCSQC